MFRDIVRILKQILPSSLLRLFMQLEFKNNVDLILIYYVSVMYNMYKVI